MRSCVCPSHARVYGHITVSRTNHETQPLPWVDVAETCRAVTNARVYFERIDLHPFAVALSFVQTVADKRVGFGALPLASCQRLAHGMPARPHPHRLARTPHPIVRIFLLSHSPPTPHDRPPYRPTGGNVLEILRNLATISRAPVQLRSFQVEHAMETPASFSHIVLAHYKRQAFAQVLDWDGSPLFSVCMRTQSTGSVILTSPSPTHHIIASHFRC